MGQHFCDCGGQSALLDAGPPGQGGIRKKGQQKSFFDFSLKPVANGPGAESSFDMKEITRGAKAIMIVNLGGT